MIALAISGAIISTSSFIAFGPASGIISIITSLVFAAIFFIFTHKRHKNIAKLADYLQQMSNGIYDLHIALQSDRIISIEDGKMVKDEVIRR